MIYKHSYFNKELKEAYLDEAASRKNNFLYGCIYVVATMAAHLVLRTLSETVIYERFPEVMLPSNFSVIFLYNYVALALFIIYLAANYRYLTFQEISDNRWYPLIKNGYNIYKMVTAKLLARFFRVFVVYTVGYVGSLLLCSIMGYQIVIHYLFSLYFVGLTDILLIYTITLAVSNFVKTSGYLGWVIILVFAAVRALQYVFSYYSAVRDRELMKDLSNLFTPPVLTYILVAAGIFAASLVVTYIAVRIKSARFTVKTSIEAPFAKDYKTNSVKSAPKRIDTAKVTNVVVTVVIAAVVVLLLVFNVAVFLMTDTLGLELTDTKPLLFRSDTMSPSISKNDLVFFKRAGEDYEFKIGDIILFEHENEEFIESVTALNGDGTVTVDILNYAPGTEKGHFVKTVETSAVERIYAGRSRGLGALVTFSTTFFGRIMLIVVPLLLILYRRQIVKWISARTKAGAAEEL